MILVRPTINLYYDKIVDGVPVPNGVSKYRINKQYYNIPVMHSAELSKNDQVIKTTYFYNVMKACEVNVNLLTGKENAPNLFYPLELSKHSSKVRIVDIISEKTLTRIKKKKMKLLVLYQQWIGDYKLMLSLKERLDSLVRYNVPPEQIYLVTGDVNCSYQELFGKIKVFGIDWWQIAYQLTCKTRYLDSDYHWVSFSAEDLKLTKEKSKLESFDIDNWQEPSMLFTALSGACSPQSLAIISDLQVKGLIDKGEYEFNTIKNRDVNPDSKILVDSNAPIVYKELKKSFINQLLTETRKIPNVKHSLENSLFAIIVEPFVPKLDKTYLSETNAMWISKNVWKCIAQGYPFIVIGSLSTMRYLNNEGYFSYVDMFNENYDTVSNLAIKVDLITKEIERLSKLNNDEIKELIKVTKPFIAANKKKFYGKKHTWKFYDLFNEMQYE